MNWAEVMKERADLAARKPVLVDASVLAIPAGSSWEPHEEWLTRVKRPRDLAALRLMDPVGNEAVELRD